jgi:hypothetical protein
MDEQKLILIRTYRYLRLAVVILVVSLGASVLIEHRRGTCWQESISAYYYTASHSIFIGALVVIGVLLITIKGSPNWEDICLNIAGMLAPIVAFVPAQVPSKICTTTPFVPPHSLPFINNNVLSLAIGGVLAILLAAALAVYHGAAPFTAMANIAGKKEVKVGLAVMSVLIACGLIWYFRYQSSFVRHAHLTAAGAMFVFIWFVVLINAHRASGAARVAYAAIAGAMFIAAAGVLVSLKTNPHWNHRVLWIEFLEIVPFAVFWAVQTAEQWKEGLDPTA